MACQVTFPALHRPLVEFLHAIPFDQKLRLGQSRSLQRRALRDLLPPAILARRGKTPFDEAYMRDFRENGAAWESLLTPSLAGARGYVDAAAAKERLRTIRSGLPARGGAPLVACVLEAWLRAHAGSARRGAAEVLEVPALEAAS
jgi:asparagine synthetase B (glutamine-hydrolysing)